MSYELRTNTAVRIPVGPLVDPGDGKTAESALDVTALSVQLYQIDGTGGTGVARTQFTPTASGGSNDMALVASSTDGTYDLELTAAQLNFLGPARLTFYDVANFLVHFIDILVVSQQYYDAKYGSGYLSAQVKGFDNDVITSGVFDESSAFPFTPASIRSALGMTTANLDTQLTPLGSLSSSLSTIATHLTQLKGTGWTDENIKSIQDNTVTALTRLTSARAGYLDKLNVAGTLANSSDAATYKADVTGLSTLNAAGVQAAVGLADANLDIQLGALSDFLTFADKVAKGAKWMWKDTTNYFGFGADEWLLIVFDPSTASYDPTNPSATLMYHSHQTDASGGTLSDVAAGRLARAYAAQLV